MNENREEQTETRKALEENEKKDISNPIRLI